jgi:hypothetical protein
MKVEGFALYNTSLRREPITRLGLELENEIRPHIKEFFDNNYSCSIRELEYLLIQLVMEVALDERLDYAEKDGN